MGELHGGQVVHDCNVDEAAGVVYHVEQSLQVWGTATRTQRWGCTLGVRGNQYTCSVRGSITVDQVQAIHNKPGAMGLTKNSSHEGKDNEHLVCRGENRLKEQAACLKSRSEISTAKMEVLGSRIHTVGWVLIP